jgi:hypothetical protein
MGSLRGNPDKAHRRILYQGHVIKHSHKYEVKNVEAINKAISLLGEDLRRSHISK